MKKFDNSLQNKSKKKTYEKPKIESVKFNASSTTVLGNCSGWKSDMIG